MSKKTKFLNQEKILIVLEVANNHQGDIDHALELVENYHQIVKNYKDSFNFAFKFQYRNLETFIHKDYVDSDIKYVRRFLDTELKNSEWDEIISSIEKYGYITMCTPFDEPSISKLVAKKFDILKIASASLDDWPLIEKIGEINNDIEIIASVGGSDFEKIKDFIHL